MFNLLQNSSRFWQRLTKTQRISLVAIFILLLALPGGLYLAQNPQIFSPKASETRSAQVIEKLTSDLINANNDYSRPGVASVEEEGRLNAMVSIASQRKEELLKEIKEDPKAFLKHANLVEQHASFPRKVQESIEEKRDVEGILQTTHFDDFENARSWSVYTLQLENVVLTVHFAENAPELNSDVRVQAKGIALGSEIVLFTGDPAGEGLKLLSSPVVSTSPIGEQRTIVLLVNFQDDESEPISVDAVDALMFTGPVSVNAYYRENSFEQTSFSGDVAGYYTLPEGYTNKECSMIEWESAVNSVATSNGIDLNSYPRRVYVAPAALAACGAGGIARSSQNFSVAWVFNTQSYVFAHELGHNLGTLHANALVCDSASPPPGKQMTTAIGDTSDCRQDEYGDPSDVMGSGGLVHFNAPRKVEMGWIPDANIQTVTGDGTYTISALERPSSNIQVVRVLKRSDQSKDGRITNTYYYFGYRRPIGFDSVLAEGLTRGISIHLGTDQPNRQSLLIDSTPGSLDRMYDASLSDGGVFYDSSLPLGVRQLTHDANTVTFEIYFGSIPTPSPIPSPTSRACIQIITPAKNPQTGECRDFPTPCDVSQGWIKVSSCEALSQSFTLAQGWSLVGLTVDKGSNYKAEDLLKDLNTSFVPASVSNRQVPSGDKIPNIYKFDSSRGRFISHTLGRTDDDNFSIVPEEGYFIRSIWPGTAILSGTQATLSTLTINRGWSIISFPTVPTGLTDSESVLQAMKNQGIDVQIIVRWFGGTYRVHGIGNDANNFPITPGEGYFIRNYGQAGTFNLP